MAVMFLYEPQRRCHPLRNKVPIPSLVMMENIFILLSLAESIYFLPLPAARHIHWRQTDRHRFSLRKRGSGPMGKSRRKIHFEERKQKMKCLPLGISDGGKLTCMAVSVCTSLAPNILDTLFHSTMDFNSFFFQNCRHFCMRSVVDFELSVRAIMYRFS